MHIVRSERKSELIYSNIAIVRYVSLKNAVKFVISITLIRMIESFVFNVKFQRKVLISM